MPETALTTTKKPVTLPQIGDKKRSGQRIASRTRKIFIQAYEEHFGNVTAACLIAGINRRTLYRWLKSESRINQKFRAQLELVRPEDRRRDMLESAHTALVQKLDPAAVIFGLKTKGRRHGWNERELTPAEANAAATESELEKIRTLVESRAQAKGITFQEELKVYLSIFGESLPEQIGEKLRELA